jgi:outer membrane protein insertion porin family
VDDFFVTGSISQRNLFGRGQILKLSGQVGGSSDLYNLSFTEPWMFDIPLSGTMNIYRTNREYDTYDRMSNGGGLGFSYPIFDYTRASIFYRYDVTTSMISKTTHRIISRTWRDQRHQRDLHRNKL